MISALVLADSDSGKGSPIGLFVVLVLVIAVYFLWRSMNRHLKKVQAQRDQEITPPDEPQPPTGPEGPPPGRG
ncbi:MAG TPA: hypothetical protein VHO01_02265 [Jatrophihabitans sp.]|nr:hypothetical protein [Jatrophihabitans sp.]